MVNLRPSFGLEVLFGSSVVFVVELMFLRRIWILSKRSLITVLPILLLICVQYAFGLLGGSTGVKVKPFAADVGQFLFTYDIPIVSLKALLRR
jgi:hypothetical protein